MKKTIIIIFLALSLAFLPACGGPDNQSPEEPQATSQPSEEAPATSQPPEEPPATSQPLETPPGAQAAFTFTSSWEISTEGDTLQSGAHDSVAGAGISVFNSADISHSSLKDLTYYIEADNIESITLSEYGRKTDGSVTWHFPDKFDLAEGNWLWSGYTAAKRETATMPMSLRRDVDKAVFDTDGYQHAEFFFSFDNTGFDSAYIQIIADEYDQVKELNASFLIDTFATDVPYSDILKKDKNKIYLRIFKSELSRIKPGVEYKLSVNLKIEPQDPKALPVLYKPFFSIGVEESHSISEIYYGNEVEMPTQLLPEHISRASISTSVVNSWGLSLFRQKTAALHEIIKKQYK